MNVRFCRIIAIALCNNMTFTPAILRKTGVLCLPRPLVQHFPQLRKDFAQKIYITQDLIAQQIVSINVASVSWALTLRLPGYLMEQHFFWTEVPSWGRHFRMTHAVDTKDHKIVHSHGVECVVPMGLVWFGNDPSLHGVDRQFCESIDD